MITEGRLARLLGLSVAAILCASIGAAQVLSSPNLLPTTKKGPAEFGIQDDTVTTISATAFVPFSDDVGGFGVPSYFTSTGLGRYCQPNLDVHYFATLNVPAGAIIDYIGLNTATDTDAVIGMALWNRERTGLKVMLAGFSVPAHGWDTDFAGPLGIQVASNNDHELVLDVEQAPSANYQYFGWVEVYWHRTVSAPPAFATFNDVPVTDPGFQYVEALAASGITAGCGGGNYCPDGPLTRRQMAVFLAKALGLHWPN